MDATTPQVGIAVFPAFRQQGLGNALFNRYLAAAAARFARVSLGVHPENHLAIGWYRRLGFVPFATGHGGDINMARNLRPDRHRTIPPGKQGGILGSTAQ